jgi:hypothetical protein
MGQGCLCMGSILNFLLAPAPLGDGADDRLAAGLDGDVLDPDHLLAFVGRLRGSRCGYRGWQGTF